MVKKSVFAEALPVKDFLHEAIYRINVGLDLTEEMAFHAFRNCLLIKDPEKRGTFMGILLNSVMAKRPTVEETVGFIRAALSIDKLDPLSLKRIKMPKSKKIICLAGSGKKGIKTMNISSCSAIIAASLGVFVAKSCSTSTSSVTGSSDFIEAVGANIEISNEKMIKIMKDIGLGFFKIKRQIPKFDSLYGGKFYTPHVLSFALAGLVLPFKSDCLLYGLAHPNIELSVKVLLRFGIKNAMVVTNTDNGIHFLDELGIFGTTSIIGTRNASIGKLVNIQIAETLKLPTYTRKDIRSAASKEENIRLAINALSGRGEQAREDIISVNAGTLLYLAGKAGNLKEGFSMTKKAIKEGKSIEKLKEFVNVTSGNINSLKKYL